MYQMGCTIDVSLVCINFLIKLHSENQDYWSLLFLKETRQTTLQLFTFWGREAPPTMQSDVGVGRPLQACKVMVYKVMKLKLNGPSPSMTYFLKTFFIRRRQKDYLFYFYERRKGSKPISFEEVMIYKTDYCDLRILSITSLCFYTINKGQYNFFTLFTKFTK